MLVLEYGEYSNLPVNLKVKATESIIGLNISRIRLYLDLISFWETLDFYLHTQIRIFRKIFQSTEIGLLLVIKWTVVFVQEKLIFLFSESFQLTHRISVMWSLDSNDCLGIVAIAR